MDEDNDSLKLKNDFISNISHELRTPLNAIINLTNFLEKTTLSSPQKNYVGMIKNSSQMLNNIVNDILDFSKLREGKVSLNLAPFNLRKVLEKSISEIELKATEKGLIVSYSIDPNVSLDYLGDEQKIIRILNNLLSNSVKFTQKGNINIDISLFNEEKYCDNKIILIKVKDTGIGINEKDIPSLFQPFRQLDNSHNRLTTGTGLGLMICKNLVELMEGKIGVESVLGVGSIFFFTLKLKPHFDPASLLEYYKSHLSGKNVLIVDDNECNRQILFDITLRWGMNPFLCPSGKDALMYAHSPKTLDLAFIDIRMPEMDGIELASKIKTIRKTLPLIAVSSIGMSFEDTNNYFLYKMEKPIEEYKLGCAVMKVLELEKEEKEEVKEIIQTKRVKILIVEDEQANRFVLKELIKKSGYTNIDEAENGLEAVKLAKENDYDIIFIDLIMPHMDGYSATKNIVKNSRKGKIPYIIAVSAITDQSAKERCYKAGCKGYISKPVVEKELETMLEVIVEKL